MDKELDINFEKTKIKYLPVQVQTQSLTIKINNGESTSVNENNCDENIRTKDISGKTLVKQSIKESTKLTYKGKEEFKDGISKLEYKIKRLRLQNKLLMKEKETLQERNKEKEKKELDDNGGDDGGSGREDDHDDDKTLSKEDSTLQKD